MDKSVVHETPDLAGSAGAAEFMDKAREKGSTLYLDAACPDYEWKKVAVVASLVGEPLASVRLPSTGDLQTLLPQARSCVLECAEGRIGGTANAIVRYLAGLRPDLELLGATEFAEARVETWLEFCWYELEVPIAAVVLPARQGEAEFDPKAVKTLAVKDVGTALDALDDQLSKTSYVAGDGEPTIADVALVSVAGALAEAGLLQEGVTKRPNFLRWFMTCSHRAVFADILGTPPKALTSKAPKVVEAGLSASAAPSAKVKSSSSSSSLSASGAVTTPAAVAAGKPLPVPGTPPLELRFNRGRTKIEDILLRGAAGASDTELVVVKGWARTVRAAKKGALLFIVLNDGSGAGDLQCVVDKGVPGFDSAIPTQSGGTGASFAITGKVVVSGGKGQAVELLATEIKVLGVVMEKDTYPMAKKGDGKGHSFEFLREKAHLRPRTKSYSSTQRLRNAMAFATHRFFYERGFLYVHTPLITGGDCEGAGEMFSVTTMLPKEPKGDLPRLKDGSVDYSKDFFGKEGVGLTVSGQLNVETHACALSDVYTFGPTFRAEDSHTSRHLAEFWMIEPEISFAGLQEDMDLAEDYLKFCVHYALTNCAADLELLETIPGWDDKLRDRLKNVLERPFKRLTYTEAVEILQEQVAKGAVSFDVPVEWGIDLGSEHERYLAEKLFGGPIIVTNYPKDIKAFYMKLDEDGRTVQAMDILVPRIGEIIGGSVREDRYDVLMKRAEEMNIDPSSLSWYTDLRKYGSVPHAGFGLGFERLVMLVTGVENIRDTIPFPRYPGHCDF